MLSGISSSLAYLFNLSLNGSEVPQAWKRALVTPVHKGGVNLDVGNFWPISVLPVVVKVFENIIHRQLYNYLQENSILNQSQFGFRPSHTIQDVLVSMTNDWRRAIDNGKLVGATMVDFSKAFGLVHHGILLRKLSKYGIKGDELLWFSSYLNDRHQRVCLGEEKFDWAVIQRGVPQGSILGPLLFIIYVNNLPTVANLCQVKQYADDTTMYHGADTPEELGAALEGDLNGLADWVSDNGLKLNENKTQLLLLSRKGKANELEKVKVALQGHSIQRCASVKCLGVIIDDGLTWKEHIRSVRRKDS